MKTAFRPRLSGRAQYGSVLLIVMGFAAVILVLGATTVYVLKGNLRKAGEQRRDFQDLHAAEAGIAFMQNRLNRLSMCNPWFTYDDSLAVVAMLRDTVVTLPNQYGTSFGFKVSDIEIIPKARPIRIRYVSTGGKLATSTTLDTTHTHAVKATLRMRTLADYARFVEGGTINYGGGASIKGRVHSGGDLTLSGNDITFFKKVSYAGSLNYGSGVDANTIEFREGYERNTTNPMTLNHIHISTAESRPTCGGALARTYEELAKGLVAHEGQGFYYTGAAGTVFLPLDSIKVQGGLVKFKIYNFDSTRADLKGSELKRDSVAVSSFNGVIYADADVFVKGTLANASLTIASTDDIMAVGSVSCDGNEAQSDNRVTLGLISQDRFLIWGKTPTHTTVEAMVVAEEDGISSKGGFNSSSFANWEALGSTSTHPGIDSLGNSASSSNPINWRLTLAGGIVSKDGGSAGPWVGMDSPSHPSRVYDFDSDNLYSPPPKFILMRASGSGISLWEVMGWSEL